jgi:GNAT superfamily N-acetyltransferase
MKVNDANGLLIRQARYDDKGAIQDVTLEAYQEYSAYVSPRQWQEYRANILETLDDVETEMQLVAEIDGAIVGSVFILPAGLLTENPAKGENQPEFPEVRLLAVKPAYRERGIGKALMEACILQARQAGERALTLHTTDLMQTAKQMYERMGFQRDPTMDFKPVGNVVIKGYRLDIT